MSRDKQLQNVELARVLEKRRLEQALNAKEFAVLIGISYSAARTWFRTPGFPAFRGYVFWQDFVLWRNTQMSARAGVPANSEPQNSIAPNTKRLGALLNPKAARVLANAS